MWHNEIKFIEIHKTNISYSGHLNVFSSNVLPCLIRFLPVILIILFILVCKHKNIAV